MGESYYLPKRLYGTRFICQNCKKPGCVTYTMKHCSPKCAAEGKSKALSAFAKAHPERRIKNCTLSHEERVRLGKEAEEQRKALGDPRWHGGASA